MSSFLKYFPSFSMYVWASYGFTLMGIGLFSFKTLKDLKRKTNELKQTQSTLRSQS
jgi:heme exporter protein D